MPQSDLKISKFNLYIPRSLKSAVYNTATGKWAWFSLVDFTRLKRGNISSVSTMGLQTALSCGILVDNRHDEDQWFAEAYKRRITSKEEAFYVIASTFRCNLRCPYCFEENPENDAGSLNKKTLERLVTAIKTKSKQDGTRQLGIMLFGGEPLLELNKNLYLLSELKKWCDQENINFLGTISTNGTLLTQKKIQELKPFIHSAQLTFDGPRALHNKLRTSEKGLQTFDKIVKGIRLLVREGINVHIRAQVQPEQEAELYELMNELKDEGLLNLPNVRISVGMLRNFSKWSTCLERWNHVVPGTETEQRLLSFSTSILPVQRPAVQITPCITTGNMLCVDPLGNLYKCVTSLTEPNRRVGVLDDRGFFRFNDHYQEFYQRNPLELDDCKECLYLPLCGGGCPKSAKEVHGSYQHSFCGHNKSLLNQRVCQTVLSQQGHVKN